MTYGQAGFAKGLAYKNNQDLYHHETMSFENLTAPTIDRIKSKDSLVMLSNLM